MIRRSWARAASIEETLALWAASLREVKKRIRPLFGQERVARNAGLFLEGLLGDEQRKTGWMRAEAAGDPGPWRQQAILGRRDWDADALRDIVRDYTPVRPARSRTARSACSLPMFRVTVMRSSIARYIFRRNGPTTEVAWKRSTCLPMSALRPNPNLRRE